MASAPLQTRRSHEDTALHPAGSAQTTSSFATLQTKTAIRARRACDALAMLFLVVAMLVVLGVAGAVLQYTAEQGRERAGRNDNDG